MSLKTIAARFAAGLVAAAAGIGLMALTAGPASAASAPEYITKRHDVVVQVSYDVHQNNIFHKADAHSFKYTTARMDKGLSNGDWHWYAFLESTKADDTYGQDWFYMSELDSAGTIKVKVDQALQFDHATAVSSDLTVTIAPNATKSFWVYTVGAGGDYIHSLVTLTNFV